MAAPKGNQFWKLRSKHGRDKLFKSPKLLLEAAHEYFEWCDGNPWLKTKSGETPKGSTSEEVPVQRPYTIRGFLHYVGANPSYWKQFKKANHKGFSPLIKEIENIVSNQQIEGSMVGTFNANIVARLQGLAENIKHDDKGGKTAEQLIERLKELGLK